jgi:hypothetical protein
VTRGPGTHAGVVGEGLGPDDPAKARESAGPTSHGLSDAEVSGLPDRPQGRVAPIFAPSPAKE